ncbi:hypothetical protein Fot_03924 [Forsythia ovata]|uniref:Uncharacterized protein n=1 Tax=Forsythia ovata TaxID=205694 RepID=A0ABD1XB31_9LAMI
MQSYKIWDSDKKFNELEEDRRLELGYIVVTGGEGRSVARGREEENDAAAAAAAATTTDGGCSGHMIDTTVLKIDKQSTKTPPKTAQNKLTNTKCIVIKYGIQTKSLTNDS